MGGISIFVDKLTKSIEEVATERSVATDVQRISVVDLKTVLRKNGWKFKWKGELRCEGRELYKLVIKGDDIIQGLISLQRAENYVEMHLIEAAPHNFGKGKKYAGVAGNLVSFACKLSFDEGFGGFVAFTQKRS